MREDNVLDKAAPRNILRDLIDQKLSAIMSYASKNRWHVAKVMLSDIGASVLKVEIVPQVRQHPMNINAGHAVGISIKYKYGKLLFETTVIGLEPSKDESSGGMLLLAIPDIIETIQKRSYYRVQVPKSQKVNATIWNSTGANDNSRKGFKNCWQARLVDLSAGGVQVVVSAEDASKFKVGHFIKMQFLPSASEKPLRFNTQIRNVLPTADENNICLGLQIVGLEASKKGRKILLRIVDVVERYYRISQSESKWLDINSKL